MTSRGDSAPSGLGIDQAARLDEILQRTESGDELLDRLDDLAFEEIAQLLELGSDASSRDVLDRLKEVLPLLVDASPMSKSGIDNQRALVLVQRVLSIGECRRAIESGDIQSAVLHAIRTGHYGTSDRLSSGLDALRQWIESSGKGRKGGQTRTKNAHARWTKWGKELDRRIATGEPVGDAIEAIAASENVAPRQVRSALRKLNDV